jgi:hypothetical protein
MRTAWIACPRPIPSKDIRASKWLQFFIPIVSLLTIFRETGITVFVMGQYKLANQGPAVDRRQLNVLMTRSRCGVVLIGGRGATTEKKTKGKDKKHNTLGNIHEALVEEGRVATVVVQET